MLEDLAGALAHTLSSPEGMLQSDVTRTGGHQPDRCVYLQVPVIFVVESQPPLTAALYCAHLFVLIVSDSVGSGIFFVFLDPVRAGPSNH